MTLFKNTKKFQEYITEKIKLKRDVKDITAYGLANTIINAIKVAYDGGESIKWSIDVLEIIKDPPKVIKKIEDKFDNKNTRKNYFSCLVSCCDIFEELEQYKEIYSTRLTKNNVSHTIEKNEANGEKTEKEKQNWIEWDEILKFRDLYKPFIKYMNTTKQKIDPVEIGRYQEYVCLSLYTYIEPSRNDYAHNKIYNKREYDNLDDETKKNTNYIVLCNKKKKEGFIIRNLHKTDKFDNKAKYDMPKELTTIIYNWKKLNKSNNLFIYPTTLKPMCETSISSLVHSIFEPTKKDISITLLRKIYSSRNKENIEIIKQFAEESKNMNHSMETAVKHYLKV